MFIDHIRIHARAGNGGDGAVHFYRGKFNPKGGPDGGDGGRGGDIILRVDSNAASLKQFFFNPLIKAEHGAKGTGRQCTGRSGKDLIVTVPQGTLVYRDKTWQPEDTAALSADDQSGNIRVDENDPDVFIPVKSNMVEPSFEDAQEYDVAAGDDEDAVVDEEEAGVKRSLKQRIDEGIELELVADLTENGHEFILCKGGKGGRGNIHFKTSTHQAPTEFTEGGKADEGMFYLELRQIADAGLVGFPNAGKSSLLTKLSAARPKVAAYPFTTLKPMVGVVEYPDYQRVTVADIPGLIEGAHENVGLGYEFLRHILRCRLLLFVVDMAGSEGRNPAEDVSILRAEIALYDPILAKRQWIVLANKMDLPESAERLKEFKQRFPKIKVLPVSAQEGDGIETLKKELFKRVNAPAKE